MPTKNGKDGIKSLANNRVYGHENVTFFAETALMSHLWRLLYEVWMRIDHSVYGYWFQVKAWKKLRIKILKRSELH